MALRQSSLLFFILQKKGGAEAEMPRLRQQEKMFSFDDLLYLRETRRAYERNEMTFSLACITLYTFLTRRFGTPHDAPISFDDVKAYLRGEPLTDVDAPETQEEYVQRKEAEIISLDQQIEMLEAKRRLLVDEKEHYNGHG